MTSRRDIFAGLREAGEFIVRNFAAPIVFYVVFEKAGAKPAIAFAIGVTAIQLLAHRIFRWNFSVYFILATVFTVVLGGADLLIDNPRYFRLEAFAQNFCVGSIFLYSLRTRRPLVWLLASQLPGKLRPAPEEVDPGYIRKISYVWAGYLYTKAVVFLYLALRVNLGQLYLLRVIIGNVTGAALFSGELLYRKRFRHKKKLTPHS